MRKKYFNTSDYNKFTKKRNAWCKDRKKEISSISNIVKNSELNKKLARLGTKAELKVEQDKIVKFQTFNSSYFHCKRHFKDEET